MSDDEQKKRSKAIEDEMRIIQGLMRGKRPGDISSLYTPSDIDQGECVKMIQRVMLAEVNQEHGHECGGRRITRLGPRLVALSVLLATFLFEMMKFHHRHNVWPKLIKCEPELSSQIRRWVDTGLLFDGQLLGVPWVQSDLDLGKLGFVFAMPHETPPMPSHEPI